MSDKSAEAKVDRHGRIRLPDALLEELGLDAGTRLVLSVQDGDLVLRPIREVEIVEKGPTSVVRLATSQRLPDHTRQIREDRLSDLGSLRT